MSKVLIGDVGQSEMLIGMAIGVVGLVVCALNYPVYAYISSNRK